MKKPLRKKSREKQGLLRKTRTKQSSSEIKLEIALPTAKLAETIYLSLVPETRQPAGFRSRTLVRRKGSILEVIINADDIVALRAASNTILRFVTVALKTLNVVAPFYRAKSPN